MDINSQTFYVGAVYVFVQMFDFVLKYLPLYNWVKLMGGESRQSGKAKWGKPQPFPRHPVHFYRLRWYY